MTESAPIYLDNAATTPLDPEVREAMQPYLQQHFANPSSLHAPAREVREEIENVRKSIADRLGCQSRELIFTSGGTEADNLALFGITEGSTEKGTHIITSTIEHKAVLRACDRLENRGYEISRVPVDRNGRISVDQLEAKLREDTVLVSVMLANNEVGTIQPIREIAKRTQERGIPLHTDAVQAAGKVQPFTIPELAVDAMTLSAHKLHGPKGVGLLYVREGVPFKAHQVGGTHESGRRAGTENVPGIIGMGTAFENIMENPEENMQTLSTLSNLLKTEINERLPETLFNTPDEASLPNVLNVSFPGVEGETLLIMLDQHDVCASTGAACESDSVETSHVLRAMNLSDDRARSAIRFSIGLQNTEQEMKQTAEAIENAYTRARQLS